MDKLKSVVLEIVGIANTTAEVLEDKKLKWTELFLFAPHITSLPSIARNMNEAIEELKALTPDQHATIVKAVQDKLDFEQEKAEQIAELAVNWLINTSSMVTQILEVTKN